MQKQQLRCEALFVLPGWSVELGVGMLNLLKWLPVSLALVSSGCMGFYGTRSTYGGSGSGVAVNGAEVSMQVKPEGTSGGSYALSAMVVGVGVANLDGPFRWRIEAEGREGVHQALYVTRIRTKTSVTKRDEVYPDKWLGEKIPFTKKQSYPDGVVKAVFEIPGRLEVKPKEDGTLEVLADVTIQAKGRRVGKTVKFLLDPASKDDREVIFLPAEIVSSIGKPVSEWEEEGWDE
ncbi:MAG: hypothetical protein ACSHX9_17595 [Luteolibacter sp.]